MSGAFRFLRLLDFSSCFRHLFSKRITCTSTSEIYLCNSSNSSEVNVTPVLIGKCFPLLSAYWYCLTWISVFPLKALTLMHFFWPRWNRTSLFLMVTPFICGSVLLPLLLLHFRPEQISFECDLSWGDPVWLTRHRIQDQTIIQYYKTTLKNKIIIKYNKINT